MVTQTLLLADRLPVISLNGRQMCTKSPNHLVACHCLSPTEDEPMSTIDKRASDLSYQIHLSTDFVQSIASTTHALSHTSLYKELYKEFKYDVPVTRQAKDKYAASVCRAVYDNAFAARESTASLVLSCGMIIQRWKGQASPGWLALTMRRTFVFWKLRLSENKSSSRRNEKKDRIFLSLILLSTLSFKRTY